LLRGDAVAESVFDGGDVEAREILAHDREQAEDLSLAALVEDELLADLRAEMELDGTFVHDVERFRCGMPGAEDDGVFGEEFERHGCGEAG
jgi:hypothetical protein